MKAGGQNRKTNAAHELAGTFRKDRHGDPDAQVEFADGAMEPPASLSEAARKEWFRISSILKEAGLLKPAYRQAIARYCTLAAMAEERGEAFALDVELRQYINMLGLCPQAASRLTVGAKAKPAQSKYADV